LGWFDLTVSTSQGIAIAKVYEAVIVVVPIMVLTKLSGADLGALYLKRGNLKWGLSIGALILFNFAASAFLFFAARFTSVDTLGAAVLWGLVFSVANGFMEELWLRGLFLKRLEPLLGMGGSVLLTSIVFALMHGGATYLTPVAIPFMVANTLTLGLACGYLIMKTDSLWGATMIHAASDFFLFIALLANA
jgi:membrane protease YdiL (CAAX protease family)